MEKIKKCVSVIVPVRNAKQFLPACVESILMQKYPAWELLLVDNGSTDGSRQICEKYAAQYDNIHLLLQTKGGTGAARNAGLKAAAGTYIMFVDADDYLANAYVFSVLVQAMEATDTNGKAADIAVGNYDRLWKNSLLPAKSHASFCELDRESAAFRFQGFFSNGVLSYVWCKLYRRSFLEKYKIWFGTYSYAQDKMFNFVCYIYGGVYTYVDQYVYVYRKNDNSVSYAYRKGSSECWLRIAKDLYRLLKKENMEQKYGDLVVNTIVFAAFFDSKMEYVHTDKPMQAVVKTLRKYRNHSLAARCFAQLATGKRLKAVPSLLWKLMLWAFSFAMLFKWYAVLALGIKLLVDWRIDERLSDTGLRE